MNLLAHSVRRGKTLIFNRFSKHSHTFEAFTYLGVYGLQLMKMDTSADLLFLLCILFSVYVFLPLTFHLILLNILFSGSFFSKRQFLVFAASAGCLSEYGSGFAFNVFSLDLSHNPKKLTEKFLKLQCNKPVSHFYTELPLLRSICIPFSYHS